MTDDEFKKLQPGDRVIINYLVQRWPTWEQRADALVEIGEPVTVAGEPGYTCTQLRGNRRLPFRHVFGKNVERLTRVTS